MRRLVLLAIALAASRQTSGLRNEQMQAGT